MTTREEADKLEQELEEYTQFVSHVVREVDDLVNQKGKIRNRGTGSGTERWIENFGGFTLSNCHGMSQMGGEEVRILQANVNIAPNSIHMLLSVYWQGAFFKDDLSDLTINELNYHAAWARELLHVLEIKDEIIRAMDEAAERERRESEEEVRQKARLLSLREKATKLKFPVGGLKHLQTTA